MYAVLGALLVSTVFVEGGILQLFRGMPVLRFQLIQKVTLIKLNTYDFRHFTFSHDSRDSHLGIVFAPMSK